MGFEFIDFQLVRILLTDKRNYGNFFTNFSGGIVI